MNKEALPDVAAGQFSRLPMLENASERQGGDEELSEGPRLEHCRAALAIKPQGTGHPNVSLLS